MPPSGQFRNRSGRGRNLNRIGWYNDQSRGCHPDRRVQAGTAEGGDFGSARRRQRPRSGEGSRSRLTGKTPGRIPNQFEIEPVWTINKVIETLVKRFEAEGKLEKDD